MMILGGPSEAFLSNDEKSADCEKVGCNKCFLECDIAQMINDEFLSQIYCRNHLRHCQSYETY